EHHFTRHTLNNLKARPVCLWRNLEVMLKKSWSGMRVAVGILLSLTPRPLLAADQSADTTAKFLAGLAVPAAPIDAPGSESPWIVHSRELDRAWKRTEQQQLPAIGSWAP